MAPDEDKGAVIMTYKCNLIKIDDLKIGIAGEHLVCADLIMQGYDAFLSDQGLPYDVVADIRGRLTKIQVKTTRKHGNISQRTTAIPSYIYHIKRCGKGGKKILTETQIDLFALVCLDTGQVGYLLPSYVNSSVFIRVDNFKGSYPNELQKKRYDEVIKLKKSGMKNTEIANIMGINKSIVGKIISEKIKFHDVGKYFSDIKLEKIIDLV